MLRGARVGVDGGEESTAPSEGDEDGEENDELGRDDMEVRGRKSRDKQLLPEPAPNVKVCDDEGLSSTTIF